jgi:MYXO-CTERM domain-containing protein
VNVPANATLSYTRALALDADVNVQTTAAFAVTIDGVVVGDETSVTFGVVDEPAHTVTIDLAAGVHELAFTARANSNVCLAVTASVTLDDIALSAPSTGEGEGEGEGDAAADGEGEEEEDDEPAPSCADTGASSRGTVLPAIALIGLGALALRRRR